MLHEWINSKVLEDIESLRLQPTFRGGEPYPHIVVKGFLQPDRAKVLSEALRKKQFEYKEADLFSFSQTDDLVNESSGALKDFYTLLASAEFSRLMTSLTGIGLRAGAINVSGTLYESTDYLLCHDDRLDNRKVAYILYLGDDFVEKDGGNFELLDSRGDGQPGEVIRRYPPMFGSLLVFEVSSKSYHAVEEVLHKSKQRYAIGGWLQ